MNLAGLQFFKLKRASLGLLHPFHLSLRTSCGSIGGLDGPNGLANIPHGSLHTGALCDNILGAQRIAMSNFLVPRLLILELLMSRQSRNILQPRVGCNLVATSRPLMSLNFIKYSK